MPFNEILMTLYIVILGIYITFVLSADIKKSWFAVWKHNTNKPYLAYIFFLLFFLLNILYLWKAYMWYFPYDDIVASPTEFWFYIKGTIFLFVPIMVFRLFLFFSACLKKWSSIHFDDIDDVIKREEEAFKCNPWTKWILYISMILFLVIALF